MSAVRCKRYHRPRDKDDTGLQRTTADKKSRCPAWLGSAPIRQRLLDEALVDPLGGEDTFGRPKRLWNAVSGWYFVGVSTNENTPAYNCYPEEPAALLDQLDARAARTLEDLEGR
jgi:hypothetical protein